MTMTALLESHESLENALESLTTKHERLVANVRCALANLYNDGIDKMHADGIMLALYLENALRRYG